MTGEQLLAMGDIGPCELVEGRIVMMSPTIWMWPPNWSPDDRWGEVKQKLREYFSIGVKLVWVADPSHRTVYAYRSLTAVREFTEADTLTGDEVLPGFSLPVASLFED